MEQLLDDFHPYRSDKSEQCKHSTFVVLEGDDAVGNGFFILDTELALTCRHNCPDAAVGQTVQVSCFDSTAHELSVKHVSTEDDFIILYLKGSTDRGFTLPDPGSLGLATKVALVSCQIQLLDEHAEAKMGVVTGEVTILNDEKRFFYSVAGVGGSSGGSIIVHGSTVVGMHAEGASDVSEVAEEATEKAAKEATAAAAAKRPRLSGGSSSHGSVGTPKTYSIGLRLDAGPIRTAIDAEISGTGAGGGGAGAGAGRK